MKFLLGLSLSLTMTALPSYSSNLPAHGQFSRQASSLCPYGEVVQLLYSEGLYYGFVKDESDKDEGSSLFWFSTKNAPGGSPLCSEMFSSTVSSIDAAVALDDSVYLAHTDVNNRWELTYFSIEPNGYLNESTSLYVYPPFQARAMSWTPDSDDSSLLRDQGNTLLYSSGCNQIYVTNPEVPDDTIDIDFNSFLTQKLNAFIDRDGETVKALTHDVYDLYALTYHSKEGYRLRGWKIDGTEPAPRGPVTLPGSKTAGLPVSIKVTGSIVNVLMLDTTNEGQMKIVVYLKYSTSNNQLTEIVGDRVVKQVSNNAKSVSLVSKNHNTTEAFLLGKTSDGKPWYQPVNLAASVQDASNSSIMQQSLPILVPLFMVSSLALMASVF